MQMYKVFFKESCFFLCDDQNLVKNGTVSLIHQDFNETKQFINDLLTKNETFKAVIFHDDLESLISIFKSCFIYVKAAGGVVNDGKNILMIKRLGMYDLPKGHLEPNESIEECAIREVCEECGIQQVSINKPLTNTLHIYFRNENWYLKKTYWYEMSAPTNQSLTPQSEEDIEAVFWFPIADIPEIADKTYPSLKAVLLSIHL